MLTRFTPFAGLEQIQRDFERAFGDFDAPRRTVGPALDVRDAGDHLLATTDVPGVRAEDIEILVQGRQLTIKGRLPQTELPEGTHVIRRERPSGSFTRVLDLPFELNPDAVEARLDNGVLTIRLPKAEKEQPRKITVSVG